MFLLNALLGSLIYTPIKEEDDITLLSKTRNNQKYVIIYIQNKNCFIHLGQPSAKQ